MFYSIIRRIGIYEKGEKNSHKKCEHLHFLNEWIISIFKNWNYFNGYFCADIENWLIISIFFFFYELTLLKFGFFYENKPIN